MPPRAPRLLSALVLLASCALRETVAADDIHAEPTAARVAAAVDPIIRSAIAEKGVPGAAFVFVHAGRIVYQRGYGVADRERGEPVDVERTVWPIASVTKLFTGVAALQLVDRGKLALDADINDHLRRINVPAQGYAPITLAQLLAHTSGLDELPGRQFDPDKGPPPAMAEFLKDRLVRYRAPALFTAYSSYGIALAGVAIEDGAGVPYDQFVRQNILEPCGMTSARIMRYRGDERGVATPYEIEDRRARPIPHEWYVTTPTSSLVASAPDMARFAMLHLADGRCGDRQILSGNLTRAMRTQQATIHPAVPGWGYAFQLDVENGRHLAEHGGDIGGFSALFTLIPEERAAFFVVNHGEGGDLRFRVKSALLDALYPELEPRVVPRPDPTRAAQLREYQGRYRSSLLCHTCSNGDPGQDFELGANAEGTLELWGSKWMPLERDLFVRADGERLLGFGRDARGRIAVVSGGSWRVLERLPEAAQ
jgi:CubicO group peptidase (beta-lactamase class C family)